MTHGVVAWHEVECGSYGADLPLWQELAAGAGGPLLELGCGTGRVALALAARGHDVTALDAEPELVAELTARASAAGLALETAVADARSFALARRFALALAPMQLVQLLGGPAGRARFLAAVRRHLSPGGLLATALASPSPALAPAEALLPLPDVRERDGWVLSSQPVAVRDESGAVAVDRVRQAVSPSGELSEELATVRLDRLDIETFEREAATAGFRPEGRRTVPETPDHLGSSVVLLRAP